MHLHKLIYTWTVKQKYFSNKNGAAFRLVKQLTRQKVLHHRSMNLNYATAFWWNNWLDVIAAATVIGNRDRALIVLLLCSQSSPLHDRLMKELQTVESCMEIVTSEMAAFCCALQQQKRNVSIVQICTQCMYFLALAYWHCPRKEAVKRGLSVCLHLW